MKIYCFNIIIEPVLDSNMKIKYGLDWALISFSIEKGNKCFFSLNHYWNYEPLIEWFIENENNIVNEDFFFDSSEKSLLEKFNIAREVDFNMESNDSIIEIWHDKLFDYQESHNIRRALKGADIPEIIIGKNNNFHEISIKIDDGKFTTYQIDIYTFFKNFKLQNNHLKKE